MKNTVRVLLFIAVLVLSYIFYFDQYLSGMVKYISLVFTFSVIVIGFLIFFENRHPTQTLTWLVVLGAFPFLGFIFYLLFGRNYRKEKMYKKKYILDKETYNKFEPGPKEMNAEMFGLFQEKHFQLAQRIGNSAISFSSETKLLTNGNETFGEILR